MKVDGFGDRLCRAVRAKGTPAMVGIDPRLDGLPEELRREVDESLPVSVASAYNTFASGVIEAVADLVPAVKFQAAFFEALGPVGLAGSLEHLMKDAAGRGLVVVLDAKRGDIGSTAEAYAEAYLGGDSPGQRWSCDAVTVNPFLGRETLDVFVNAARTHGRGVFVLVRTSNPGSGDLQLVKVEEGTISHRIAGWVEDWSKQAAGRSGYGPIGAVVGGTHPDEIAEFRSRMPHVPLLIPGYGAQGATAQDIGSAFDVHGLGGVVNNSRGILHAHKQASYAGLPWKDAIRAATEAMIVDLAENTPAGNLRS